MADRIDIKIPVSWNELTRKQLLKVCRLFRRGLEEHEFLSLAVIHLAGLKVFARDPHSNVHEFRYQGKRVYMDSYQFGTFCNSLRYLIGRPALNDQKIPFIRRGFRKYYGPSSMLYNMSFGEWIQVDIYMQHYRATKEMKYLELATAAMYRRKDRKKIGSIDFDGDIRVRFNEHLVEKHAKKFRGIPSDKLMAISIFFNGCISALSNRFPLTLQESSGGSRGDLLKDTLTMIDQLNNDDVTKNSAVQQTRLYEVLAKLEVTRERSRKLNNKKKVS